jgi:hypothetical protein
MSERRIDAKTAMDLLQTKLHPLSPELLAMASRLDGMPTDGIIIDRKKAPEYLQAARALVKIGVLQVINAGKMKEITLKDRKDLHAGMLVDFFKTPGYVLADKSREAIMKWINSLDI